MLAISLGLIGCRSSWYDVQRAQGHQLPKHVPIYVAVSDEIAETDDQGLVLTMVETLETDLREQGHVVRIVPARPDELPPVPRVELQVVGQARARKGMQGAGALVFVYGPLGAAAGTSMVNAGRGSVVVDCYVVNRRSVATFSGRLEAFATTEQQSSAGENAGHAIARSIAN